MLKGISWSRASLKEKLLSSVKDFRECIRADRGKGNARLVQLHNSKCPPSRWPLGQRSSLRTHPLWDQGVVWGGGQESEEELSDKCDLPAAVHHRLQDLRAEQDFRAMRLHGCL